MYYKFLILLLKSTLLNFPLKCPISIRNFRYPLLLLWRNCITPVHPHLKRRGQFPGVGWSSPDRKTSLNQYPTQQTNKTVTSPLHSAIKINHNQLRNRSPLIATFEWEQKKWSTQVGWFCMYISNLSPAEVYLVLQQLHQPPCSTVQIK